MPKRASVELTKSRIDAALPGQFIWDGGQRGINGLCVRVTKAGSRTFAYRYRTGTNAQRWVKIGSYPALTIEQARHLARGKAGEVADGGDPSKARKALRSAPTVSDLAEYYTGAYAASKPLRASTARDARDVLRHVLPTLGRLKIPEVTADDIRKARAKVKAMGRANAADALKARASAVNEAQTAVAAAKQKLALAIRQEKPTGTLTLILDGKERQLLRAETLARKADEWARTGRAGIHQANRLLSTLGTMFTLAIEQGARADNPCRAIKKEEEDERWRNLSDGEVGRLLDACDAYEAENAMEATARGAADAIRLLLFTGARLREVLGADWSQFDVDRGMWEKPSAHTKTKRQHRLELDGPALDLVRDMKERRTHPRFLFPGDPHKSRTGKVASEVARMRVKPRVDLKRPWGRVVELADLDDVRLHDLRRTTASFMLSGGASLAAVGKSLGHTQARTTSRYAHLSENVQRSAMRAAQERMIAQRSGVRPTKTVVPLRQLS